MMTRIYNEKIKPYSLVTSLVGVATFVIILLFGLGGRYIFAAPSSPSGAGSAQAVACSNGYGFADGLTKSDMANCAKANSALCGMYLATWQVKQSQYQVQMYDVCKFVGQLGDNPPPRPTPDVGEAVGGADPVALADDCANPDNASEDKCGFNKSILVPFVNVLSMAIGLVVVLSIVISGIMYITSNGNSQQVETAKGRIFNSVVALVVYIFGFALLQWLIPGGVFNPK